MANIREIFKEKIERPINGVIKAGTKDDDSLFNELKEYVLTTQLKEHFEEFFKRYLHSINNSTEDVGVWISGFFGSGKSHLLKMLGVLLENKEVKGKLAIDYFEDKVGDKNLYNDIKKAEENKIISILFNIDESSDQNTRLKKDSIVRTLLREFNKYCGYSDKFLKLASFERKIDSDGIYDEFKEKYVEITGVDWIKARKNVYLLPDDFVEVVVEMKLMSKEAAFNLMHNDEEEITPKDFAGIIKDYLDKKGRDYRIVFLLDEVGQYINYESILWLNLQTVSEVLGTTLKGKAWIMVTSQEDMESINNEMRKIKNETSKIQGRFKTTLRLTSENIDEVIKKRLLEKTESYKKYLEDYYIDNDARIKNTIHFAEGTATYPKYKNEIDFSETYPFVSYQFPMLQSVFENIRKQGYSGRHLSQGERSLLNAFQEAAENILDKEIGCIVPFNDFYNSIEKFLDPIISKTISHANRNKNLEKFDVEILKVLFMIKDIQGLKANVENLVTLMASKIDENKIDLKKKIEKSLMNLKAEVLIQQNDKEFRFLTDEEQNVSKYINDEIIPQAKINGTVSDILYKDIFATDTYKSKILGNNYKFNRMLNEEYVGEQNNEIGINIINIYSGNYTSEIDNTLLMLSNSSNNLIVRLPNTSDYIEEIEESLKIDQYIGMQNLSEKTESVKKIIKEKTNEAHNRLIRARQKLEEAVLKSDVIAKGDVLQIKTDSPSEKIKKGLEELLQKIYSKNSYLATKYTTDSVKDIFNNFNPENSLMAGNMYTDTSNRLAFKEIKDKIDLFERMSFNEIVNIFSKVPYGWSLEDIAGLVAKIFINMDIDLIYNSEKQERKDVNIANHLLKRRAIDRDKVLIQLIKKIDPIIIERARKAGLAIFRDNSLPETTQELIQKIKENITIKIETINKINLNYRNRNKYQYPGMKDTKDWDNALDELKGIRDEERFLIRINSKKDDYLELRDKFEDYIKDFFEDERKKGFFDEGVITLEEVEKYKNIITDIGELESVKNIIDILSMENPYRKLKDITIKCDEIEKYITKKIELKKGEIENKINQEKEKLISELKELNDKNEILDRINIEFDNLVSLLKSSSDFEIFNIAYKISNVKSKILNNYKIKVKTYIRSLEEEVKKEISKKEKDPSFEKESNEIFRLIYSDLNQVEMFDRLSEIRLNAEIKKEDLLAKLAGKEIKRPEVRIDLKRNAPKEIKSFQDVDKFVEQLRKSIKDEIKKGNKVIF